MASPLDGPFRSLAKTLVSTFGTTAVFTEETAATYDPTTLETTTTTVQHTKKVSPPQPVNLKLIDGVNIKSGDFECILDAKDLAFSPVIGMSVSLNNVDWEIVRISQLYSGEQIAAYQLFLRR